MSRDYIEIPDLPLADEYFEIGALKTAVWTYILDHAQPVPGGLRIFMVAKDKEDFWRRVSARKYGDYRRADELKLIGAVNSKNKRLQTLEIGVKKTEQREKRLNRLRAGSLTERSRYWGVTLARRFANYLIRL